MINKTHSVTKNTPQNIALGAGIVVYGLTYAEGGWSYTGIFGATNGGSKLEIKPVLQDLEVDGVLVKVKGLTAKLGETATLETNLAEVTTENLRMATVGKNGEGVDGFDEIVSKPRLEENDYIENLGFIGHKLNGDPTVIKLDYALCTSGLDFEAKNKEQSTIKVVFECTAELEADDLTVLPWHIYNKASA